MPESKKCNSCLIEKSVSDFYLRKETGLPKNRCKRCCIEMRTMVKNTTHKVCKHCGESKEFSEYQKAGRGKWLQPYCKPCDKARKQKHKKDNEDAYAAKYKRDYAKIQEANKLRIKPVRLFKKDDKEYVKKRTKAYTSRPEVKARKKESDRLYKIKNLDKIKQMRQKHYESSGREQARLWQQKMSSDIEFVTKKRLRGRIYVALKRGVKSHPTISLLGCSIQKFKEHFESLFTDGMNWDVYLKGGIHIDHIIPCKHFDLTNPEEQKVCFHYTNMQPLWEIDNLKKGATLNYQINING